MDLLAFTQLLDTDGPPDERLVPCASSLTFPGAHFYTYVQDAILKS